MRDWPAIRKHAGLMTLLALTGFSAYNTMAYYGLQYTTAINGLLLQSVGPLFVALWTFALFGDRLTLRQAGGICVSLTGVLVIICHGSLAVLIGIGFNRGDVWFVIALLIYALSTRPCCASGRRSIRCRFSPSAWAGARCCSCRRWSSGIASGQTMVSTPRACASFAFVCIFPSLLGYLFLNRGIELIGANRAAPFMHLVPVFGSVMAIVLLGERFELYHAVGYALVFGHHGGDAEVIHSWAKRQDRTP